jgi:hypothetical protein
MEVSIIPKKKLVGGSPYLMIHITRLEALSLIKSLAEQVQHEDPNVGRLESHSTGGDFTGYVSIAVGDGKASVGDPVAPTSRRRKR